MFEGRVEKKAGLGKGEVEWQRKSPLSLKDALELGGPSELFKLSQGDRLLYLS